jgi:dolichol-phosphate mannosyltransferase
MRLSVIICVYNERDTVLTVLERVQAVDLGPGWEKEIIVVDNFSTDGTRELLQGLDLPDVQVIFHPRNLGKGTSVRTAIAHCTGDYAIIQDADLEYDPNEIPLVVDPIRRGEAEIVYGNRFAHGLPRGMPLPNKIANLLLVWTVRILFGRKLHDEATCYKAFRSDLLKSMDLRCTRFEFCPEVTAKVLKGGSEIREVDIRNYRPRVKLEGKKIRWTDGLEAIFTLFRYRFFD